MRQFYVRCLLDANYKLGENYLYQIVQDMAEENNPDVAEEVGTLEALVGTKEGLRLLLHNEEFLSEKLVLHNALVKEVSNSLLKNELGDLPDTTYKVDEYDATPEIADDLIVGESDPDALIAFADGMQEAAAKRAKDILVEAELYGKVLDDEFLAQTGPDTHLGRVMHAAFCFMVNTFLAETDMCYYDSGLVENYPEKTDLKFIHDKPENYIVITLLFKD